MAVLLTGGLGAKTAYGVAPLLEAHGTPFLFASRSGAEAKPFLGDRAYPAVKLDWTDPSTYGAAFEHQFPGGDKITSVLIVHPPAPFHNAVNAFVDFACTKGVRRFVLVTGISSTLGSPGGGLVWQHLIDTGVEFTVLRATWFSDNFITDWMHLHSIKNEGKFYTCCGDGKIAFITAEDICAVGFAALTAAESPNAAYILTGPKAISNDEAAEILSNTLGRKIEHVKLSQEEQTRHFVKLGFPEPSATFLAMLEDNVRKGNEDNNVSDAVVRMTGHNAKSFEAFVQEHRNAWD